MATYAEDAQHFEHPAKLLASGSAQLPEGFVARFKEPNLHAMLAKRIVMGNVRHPRDDRTAAKSIVRRRCLAEGWQWRARGQDEKATPQQEMKPKT